MFKFMTGTEIVHVPYKGGAPAINDLIAGRVQLMFESLNSIAPFARSGQVRALGVSGDTDRRRSPICRPSPRPVPGYSAPTWTGVIAPAGVPRPIVDKLNAAINKAIQSAAFKDADRRRSATTPAGGTPEEFGALIASESKKWGDVIERAGIKIGVAPSFRDCSSPRANRTRHTFPAARLDPYWPTMPPKSRDPAKHSKKDPAKPTRAKASRPDSAALDPSLAEMLNPAIGQGRAGLARRLALPPPCGGGWGGGSEAAHRTSTGAQIRHICASPLDPHPDPSPQGEGSSKPPV